MTQYFSAPHPRPFPGKSVGLSTSSSVRAHASGNISSGGPVALVACSWLTVRVGIGRVPGAHGRVGSATARRFHPIMAGPRAGHTKTGGRMVRSAASGSARTAVFVAEPAP
jgi:hypothetical protein